MSTVPKRKYPRSSWAAGIFVLLGLAWTLWTLWSTARSPAQNRAAIVQVPQQAVVPVPRGRATDGAPAREVVRRLQGIVREPNGQPANGATVVAYLATTAAPEWQRERLDQAITSADGSFVFGLPVGHGLLIGFDHARFAGGLLAVPEQRDELVLDLEPGFELGGIVTNDLGVPLGGVRVAAESSLEDRRRFVPAITTANGGYRFTNLPAGLVRLVARHERWQAVVTPVLVGERQSADFRFTTPAAAPLRGRVVSTGQVPIADAVIDLLPTNGRLGFVDSITARSDSDGLFVLTGLSRGPMSLLVRHADFGALRRTVSVGASPTETVLELPQRSLVSGHLIHESEEVMDTTGVALQISDAAGEIHHVTVGAAGAFTFEGPLSPGRATILAHGGRLAFARSQSCELTVHVEEGARTVLDLPIASPTIVRGRCVDEAGHPLAGVAIHGSKQLTASRLIGSNLATWIGAVGEEVALTLGADSASWLAQSGSDGVFEFRGQEPGPLLIHYELPTRAGRQVRVIVPPVDAVGDLGDIVMPRGARLEGVVQRGKRPLAGATVSVIGEESQATVLSGVGGKFLVGGLLPGTYRVRARLPSMPTGHAEQQVTIALDKEQPRLVLELPPGRVVTGVVTGPDGQPVGSALVSVRGGGGQPTLTDASGKFMLELPARTIELQVSLGDKSRSRVETVMPWQQELAIRLDAPPTGTLAARVVGLPGRKRVPGVLLRFRQLGGGEVADDRSRWVEVQNGELRWPLCPVGRCRIEVRCDGYTPFVTERDLVANEEQDLGEILLEPGGRVRGRAVDSAGRPVANARVFVGDEADLDAFEPQVRTASDGSFEIAGVSTRASTVIVYAAGFSPAVHSLQLPRDVLVSAPLELLLQPGSTIAVQVRDAPEVGLVQLFRNGRFLATAVLDDGGRAEFADRGPGDYEVRLYASDTPAQQVSVKGVGETVRVVID